MNTSDNGSNFSEFTKHLPKTIYQDKERLYADTLKYKNQVNELQKENTKVKTKLANVEVIKSLQIQLNEN